jgi:hypothetical protein
MIIIIISFTKVFSRIKQTRLNPLSKPLSQPGPSSPFLLPTDYHCRLLVFPDIWVSSSSVVKDPLSSQVGKNLHYFLYSRVFPYLHLFDKSQDHFTSIQSVFSVSHFVNEFIEIIVTPDHGQSYVLSDKPLDSSGLTNFMSQWTSFLQWK